jgi:LysM repeat protein
MTDRATPGDGSPACPFIAFEDERDERSSSPDHRHRCYAEVRPAPRALAHQEAYCLSSAFPVCPTFQDWARREAARTKGTGRPSTTPIGAAPRAEVPEPAAAAVPVADANAGDAPDDDLWSAPRSDDEPVIHRNPPRDWAAPPPWATGAGAGSPGRSVGEDRPPEFLASRSASQGLAGSAADRMATGLSPSAADTPAAPASDDLADLVAPSRSPRASDALPPISRPPTGHFPTTSAAGRRPSVSATRERTQLPDHDGPSWERAKRYEAYPTIKTRVGLPGIPRLGLWAGALVIAALALFFVPGLFSGDGSGAGPGASATPGASSAAPSASPTITPVPSPTAQTYTIKKGDTLSKIAKRFGVTVDQIIDANKDTIKDPNKIKVGDEIIIPVPLPDEIVDPSAETPSSSPSP